MMRLMTYRSQVTQAGAVERRQEIRLVQRVVGGRRTRWAH